MSSDSLPTIQTPKTLGEFEDVVLRTNPLTGQLGLLRDAVGPSLSAPGAPGLESPDAKSKQPTQAEVNTTAIQNQLLREQNSMATSTFLTGGQGVATPNSTSNLLMGSYVAGGKI